MAPKKTLIVKGVATAGLAGCAVWLFLVIGSLGDQVQGILDSINSLKDVSPLSAAGQGAGDAAAAVPDDVMDQVEQAVPLMNIFAIVPAALIFILNLVVVVMASQAKKGQGAFCTKMIISLTLLACLLGVVFYLIIGGVGMAIDMDPGKDALDQLLQPCEDFTSSLQATLATGQTDWNQAKQEYDDMPSSAPQSSKDQAKASLDDAKFELDEASKAVNALADMCFYMGTTFDEFKKFTVPGLGCFLFCFVLFILNICACCHLGCCCKSKAKAQSSEAELATHV